jgi:HK97 family phage major capsid protein
MNLNEQIVAKQTELVNARDVLVDLTSKMDDSQESQDAVQAATATVEKATAELDRLKAAEAAISKSVARAASNGAPAINSNPAAKVKDSDKADLLIKSALCTFDAYVKRIPLAQAIEQRYGDNEVIKAVAGMTTKAAQDPAMTNVAGWAQELTRESYGAFMDILRGESVVPRLPLTRYEFAGAASIKVPQRNGATPNLAGAFRAEGAAIRVGALGLTAHILTPKSMGVIGTWTAELMERSTPQIEAIVRDAMIQDTATALDTAFLGATAGSITVPAGLQTYASGADTTASAGATTANIITDVRGRLQQLMGQNLGRRPVWIMNPARWIGVQLAVTAAGTPAFPEAAAGTLMGYPVVTSTNVPSAVVFLIDAAEVAFAGGAPRFMGTEVATIHEEDTTPLPIIDDAAAPAKPVRSLFQTNSAALRCVWELDWAALRPGAVQTLTAVAW